jgi:hypothetical protein
MSDIRPRTTIPDPHDTAPTPQERRARTRARRVLGVGLLLATFGIALLLASSPAVGMTLLVPGVLGAAIAEYRLARLPRYGGTSYRGPHSHYFHQEHSPWWPDFGGGDWGGGGGGDGGGGGG